MSPRALRTQLVHGARFACVGCLTVPAAGFYNGSRNGALPPKEEETP